MRARPAVGGGSHRTAGLDSCDMEVAPQQQQSCSGTARRYCLLASGPPGIPRSCATAAACIQCQSGCWRYVDLLYWCRHMSRASSVTMGRKQVYEIDLAAARGKS